MIYFWEVDPERMLTSINTKYKDLHFKKCTSCSNVCEVDKMCLTSDYSICFRCIQEDHKMLESEHEK
jgi:hypothetical protein